MKLRQSIAEFLSSASRALDNGLHDEEISTRLARFGYTTEKLQEGWALYETASQLYQEQRERYGDQYGATDRFKEKWEAADERYHQHIKVARLAFEKDRNALTNLALIGRRPKAFGTWLQVAKQFYTVALAREDIRTRLATFGLTEEQLQAGLALVEEAEAAEHAQEKARGDAQKLTKRRDQAVEALRSWMEDYLTIARIAVKDEPQLAEKLGLLAPS